MCALVFEYVSLASAAEEADVSVNTAKTHLRNGFRKFGVRSKSELVKELAGFLTD